MANSCQCMAKPLQYCQVISLQLIKINGKKNNKKKEIIQSNLMHVTWVDFKKNKIKKN